jgi:hypothetical protein
MERRGASGRRGVIVLAVAVLAAGALAASSAGAAGTLTKAKVKKIATKVFNQNAPSLKDKCPSGTMGYAGACFETTARSAANYDTAAQTCGNLGRRLPTASELFGLRLVAGITLAGLGTDAEMSSDMFRDATFGFFVVEDDGDVYGHQGTFSTLENPYRCVAPLTNA